MSNPKTTAERLSLLEISQARLDEQYKTICEKLDKIITNEQKHIDLLIKAIAIIAVGERLVSALLSLAGG